MNTQVIAIANQKGGVGKTTTVINLAACLAERRQRVLLVDLDPQANATSGLGVPKEEGKSLYRALLGEAELASFIRGTAVNRLDLVPAEVDLAGAEVDVARSDNYLHPFKTALQPVLATGAYDWVLVDCPPSLGILTMNALTAADALLIPMQCEYFALEGLAVMMQLVERLRAGGANPGLRLEGIVMTMYDMRTNLSQQVVQEVATHLADKVYETLIPRSVRLGESPSYGQPIIVYDGHCVAAAAYRSLAKEFLQRIKGSTPPPSLGRGLTVQFPSAATAPEPPQSAEPAPVAETERIAPATEATAPAEPQPVADGDAASREI